jgi:hypothetical protein
VLLNRSPDLDTVKLVTGPGEGEKQQLLEFSKELTHSQSVGNIKMRPETQELC